MTVEQVHEAVQRLRSMSVHTDGIEAITTEVAKLEAAGWKLGICWYSHKITKGRKGHALMKPRNGFRNIGYFYDTNTEPLTTGWRVWYWDNMAITKEEAIAIAERTPPPPGTFITYSKPTTSIAHLEAQR